LLKGRWFRLLYRRHDFKKTRAAMLRKRAEIKFIFVTGKVLGEEKVYEMIIFCLFIPFISAYMPWGYTIIPRIAGS
jgi:hypothetical protein